MRTLESVFIRNASTILSTNRNITVNINAGIIARIVRLLMSKYRLKYTASVIIDVDSDLYPKGCDTIDKIIEYEKSNEGIIEIFQWRDENGEVSYNVEEVTNGTD